MNDVINLLKRRCAFDFQWAPGINIIKNPFIIRPLSDAVTRLRPPQVFIEFYEKCDGGYQNFFDHGWPRCTTAIQFRLYSENKCCRRKKSCCLTRGKNWQSILV